MHPKSIKVVVVMLNWDIGLFHQGASQPWQQAKRIKLRWYVLWGSLPWYWNFLGNQYTFLYDAVYEQLKELKKFSASRKSIECWIINDPWIILQNGHWSVRVIIMIKPLVQMRRRRWTRQTLVVHLVERNCTRMKYVLPRTWRRGCRRVERGERETLFESHSMARRARNDALPPPSSLLLTRPPTSFSWETTWLVHCNGFPDTLRHGAVWNEWNSWHSELIFLELLCKTEDDSAVLSPLEGKKIVLHLQKLETGSQESRSSHNPIFSHTFALAISFSLLLWQFLGPKLPSTPFLSYHLQAGFAATSLKGSNLATLMASCWARAWGGETPWKQRRKWKQLSGNRFAPLIRHHLHRRQARAKHCI